MFLLNFPWKYKNTPTVLYFFMAKMELESVQQLALSADLNLTFRNDISLKS